MIATGLTDLPRASTAQLCRRISLDLAGVAPAAGECDGKSVEEMVRHFLASPRFIPTERRFWIRRFGADPTAMMGDHIADADRIIDAVATGLAYDDFAAQLLAHPIFTISRPAAEANNPATTIDKIFRTWLGRAPSFDEAGEYATLLRPWTRRFEDRYGLDYSYYVHPAALDPAACKAALGCTSTLFDLPTTLELQLTPRVPPGYSQTSAQLFYYEMGPIPAAVQAELEKPGRLLATRDEFWDEAADLALARMLGWWRSSANEPETVLPEVRRALAEWFRDSRDLRELYVVVMTSLLYTTSTEVASQGELPPWGTGPTKLLEPEQLLDSAAKALDRPLGLCDPHTDEEVGLDWYWPSRLRTPQPADWYGFGTDFYRATAQQLGGCLGAVGAPKQPGLPAMLTHIEVAARLCEGVNGDGADLVSRFLQRPPTAAEQAALAAAAQTCGAEAGCNLARQTCGALLRSAAFLYY